MTKFNWHSRFGARGQRRYGVTELDKHKRIHRLKLTGYGKYKMNAMLQNQPMPPRRRERPGRTVKNTVEINLPSIISFYKVDFLSDLVLVNLWLFQGGLLHRIGQFCFIPLFDLASNSVIY
jgi:hypothetical protein